MSLGGDGHGLAGPLEQSKAQSTAQAKGRLWWFQFPAPLRELAMVRLIASIGAGGVLYLTPMVFHREAFSASAVGQGLALAAVAGTVGRFASGALLDRGLNCSVPVLLAVLFSARPICLAMDVCTW